MLYIYMLSDSCSQCCFLLRFTRSLSHTTFTHTHSFVTHTHNFSLSHTIFHTQLCHTHTHHFSLSHTIFRIPLCHTHNSSHTTCFTSRSSITSFLFPSFPVPPTTFVDHYWKKLTCGVIRSFNFCFATTWWQPQRVLVLHFPWQVRGTAVMGSVSAMVNRRATPARLMTLEEVCLLGLL